MFLLRNYEQNYKMEFLNDVWGIKENMGALELSARAIVMFFITLIMIRVSGMRPFNKSNAFEAVIAILIGGVLSRGVVGATPFFSTVIGSIAMLVVLKLIARFSFYNELIEKVSKGEHLLLYKDGRFLEENMKKSDVTTKELYEGLRLKCNIKEMEEIEEVIMEKSGELSFIKKKSPSNR